MVGKVSRDNAEAKKQGRQGKAKRIIRKTESLLKKRTKRVTVRPSKIIRTRQTPAAPESAADVEELLVKELLSESIVKAPGTPLHTLIYNSSPSMSLLAYRHGLSIGKHAYADGSSGIKNLLHLIEKAGIGRAFYYPSKSSSILKASGGTGPFTGRNMHSYEAGIIAGYHSAQSGALMHTSETNCIHNGSGFCQFVIALGAGQVYNNQPIPTFSVIRAMEGYITRAQALHDAESSKYSFLSLMPVLEHSLSKKAAALLFFAGKDLGRTQQHPSAGIIDGIASFLGISEGKVIKDTPTKFSIELRYAAHNSADGFVELSMPMFAGFLNSAFNSAVRVESRKVNAGRYVVVLSVKRTV